MLHLSLLLTSFAITNPVHGDQIDVMKITNVEFDQFLDTEVKWDPEALLNRTNTFKTDILTDKKRVKDDTSVQKVVECSENASSCPEVYQFNLPLSVPSPPAVGLCCRCNLPGILLCSVCKAWYCSAACQKDDWFTHIQGS